MARSIDALQMAIWYSNELELIESEVIMEITNFSFDFFGPIFCEHPPPSTTCHFTYYISYFLRNDLERILAVQQRG